MTVLFLNEFNDYWKEKFRNLKQQFPETEFIATFDPAQRADSLRKADVVICGRLSAEEIDNSTKLKAIFVPFTGLNNFPLEKINERGIVISNTHANARFVAEHAVALALSLLGRIIEFHNDISKGIWDRSIESDDMWTSLYGRTAGIIGLGHIGLYIAKFVKAFGCKVIGHKQNVPVNLPDNVDEVSADLKYTIDRSDIIFVTLPLNDKTRNLIDVDILMNMKGKYLVNVGRGLTVNEEALYNSLKNGILAGAAIDVWYNYPGKLTTPVFPSKFPFQDLPNVVMSPHKSSHTTEAISSMIDNTFESIGEYIRTSKSPTEVRI
jgi:phosphoglycerate dehydrogenase-like enzyme